MISKFLVDVQNENDECWNRCGAKQGPCHEFCGNDGRCCRIDWIGCGCDGTMGKERTGHVCVGKKEEPSGVELDIKNEGKDCWKGCGENQDVGQCDWCGKDGMCCRMGWTSDGGCDGCLGGDSNHVCVKKPWYL